MTDTRTTNRSAPRISAARDLEALAQVYPTLDGTAMPLIRIPGGQQDGSPAERVQPLLEPALRGMRRLAWLRAKGNRTHVIVLLAMYCYAGETRANARWLDTVQLAVLPRAARIETLAATVAGKGPDARALQGAASKLLAAANDAYLAAEEQPSDGRWLATLLDEVSRLIAEVEADRKAATTKTGPSKSTRAATTAKPCDARCAVERDCAEIKLTGGRLFARPSLARCLGCPSGARCARRRRDRWVVRGSALLLSPVAGMRPWRAGRKRPSKTWTLLSTEPTS